MCHAESFTLHRVGFRSHPDLNYRNGIGIGTGIRIWICDFFSDVSAAVLLPLDEVHSNSLVGATETTDISG